MSHATVPSIGTLVLFIQYCSALYLNIYMTHTCTVWIACAMYVQEALLIVLQILLFFSKKLMDKELKAIM